MSGVRDCDVLRIHKHSDWSIDVVFPCFTIPLVPGLIALAFTWWCLWKEAKKTDRSVQILSVGILLIETVFGVFCWAQCVALWLGETYVGGLPLCAFQGWYAGFYMLSQPLLVAVISLFTTSWKRGSPLPSTTKCSALAGGILSFATMYPLLPLFGVGHYTFPTAFCMVDLMDPTFAVPFLLAFVLMTVSMLRLLASMRPFVAGGLGKTCGCMIAVSTIGWSVTAAIACVGLFNGSACGQNVFGGYAGAVYGLFVIQAHLNQLISPLLYGLYWRRGVSDAIAIVKLPAPQ